MRAIDYFDKGAERNLDRIAIMDGTRQYTFRETRDASHRIARAMWAAGLNGEEPAAIYAPNDIDVLLCLLGLMRAGAVWIPVNARNAIDANMQYMNYVRTKWLFYHSSYRDDVLKLKAGIPSLKHCICLDQTLDDDPSLPLFMGTGDGQADLDWSDAFASPARVVGIFATGGTTGPAKGVNVTNMGWGTMLEIMYNYWRGEDVEQPVCLSSAPLTHAAGVVALATFQFGATQVVMPGFDAGKVLENIPKYRVTHMFLPPTAFYGLLDHPSVRTYDYSTLRMFLLVASPVAPEKLKQGVEVFGPVMCQCFGQVESPMIVTWLPQKVVAAAAAGDHPERLKSCGAPSYAVRVGILSDDGKLQPVGEVGEICVRSRLVSHSYFEKPESTTEIRTHNWHHTGDVGYQDADGYVYIVDRKKDMVVTGGFNVFSAEVEACVMEMPGVRECAVIGVPDPKWGEAVKAVVVISQGTVLTEDAVIAHCKQRLGSVKAPKSVEFWAAIPRTANGKVDKKEIRKEFWAGRGRGVN